MIIFIRVTHFGQNWRRFKVDDDIDQITNTFSENWVPANTDPNSARQSDTFSQSWPNFPHNPWKDLQARAVGIWEGHYLKSVPNFGAQAAQPFANRILPYLLAHLGVGPRWLVCPDQNTFPETIENPFQPTGAMAGYAPFLDKPRCNFGTPRMTFSCLHGRRHCRPTAWSDLLSSFSPSAVSDSRNQDQMWLSPS